MGRWYREVQQAVARVPGVHGVELLEGGRHLRVRVTGATGVARTVFVSRTPSDDRTLANVRRDVRRALTA